MAVSKIAITIDENLLKELDEVSLNRDNAIQEIVVEKLAPLKKVRLAKECAKLNPDLEQNMAEDEFYSPVFRSSKRSRVL